MRHYDYHEGIDGPQSFKSCGRTILCKGGGGGDSVTTQEIPAELKPLASAYTTKAINLGNTGYTPYTGQRYADLNGIQTEGIGKIYDRAVNGSELMNQAESGLSGMIQGAENPYLDQSVNNAMNKVRGQVNSQFNNSNYGTTAHQETLSNSLGDVANQMYSGNYQSDQNRRLQAIGAAQSYGNQAYTDASQLMKAGQTMQDQQQQQLDFNYQQFQDKENLPYKQLAAMSGVFGSNLGGTSRTESSGGGK